MFDNMTSEVGGPPNSTYSYADQKWIEGARFFVEGVTQLIVGIIGLVGNMLSIAVLCRRDMDLKPMFRQILVTLISFDIGCIIFNLLLFSLPLLSNSYSEGVFPYIVPVVLPFAQISLTGSIYCTLAVAIERYVSVCHPLRTPSDCTGTLSIIGLIVFSVAINICRFLEFETTYEHRVQRFWNENKNQSDTINVTYAMASTTELRSDLVYSQITMVTMLLIGGIIPLVVLTFLNTRIYIAIRTRTQRLLTMSSKQRRDFDVAAVLVGIILVFIVCHSFKFFVNCYEVYMSYVGMDVDSDWGAWMDVVLSFSHLSVTVNSSLNFVIYCYKDEKFRQNLIRMCVVNGGCCRKHGFSPVANSSLKHVTQV
ncbi:FMRFamide receptor-like [Tigriopus californicus]|uniref:FMRFamide receptor-like n=1 Tax=Tigriopus californicus TaxID=6832 RepID=UPI0027DA29E0|nr:FMRFamide receptor-like [Tigriopus californicus]